MTHPLQTTFATVAGEAAWEDGLRDLFERRELAEAERMLRRALIATGGRMMELCRRTTLDRVEITGWEELVEAISLHEGAPVSGATIALGAESDPAFARGTLHRPFMMLGLYTDEAWNWSSAGPDEALEQCRGESPAWAGQDEDIEAFLEIEGLDELNTALIQHQHRHFLRDDADASLAPPPYVEFVLGCWWRALRFHQAVAVQLDRHGLCGTIPVISGLIGMRPEVVSVHWPIVRPAPVMQPLAADHHDEEEDDLPTFIRFDLIQRGRLPVHDGIAATNTIPLRRPLDTAEAEAIEDVVDAPGLMQRLLGRP